MTKHTPGPWRIVISPNARRRVEIEADLYPGRADTLAVVFDVENRFDAQDENRIANAHLIAAAPDLLEALKAIYEVLLNPDPWDREHVVEFNRAAEKVRAAIAKAETS